MIYLVSSTACFTACRQPSVHRCPDPNDLICLAPEEYSAHLLEQVIAERAEKAAVIVTTNLPFSEWPQVFTNAQLCKAVLDRLTDQAHIIETGSESYRFRRTLRKKPREE